MTSRRDILAKTERIIDILKALPPDEVAIGWDEARVKTWLPIFEKLRDALAAPVALPKEYESLIIARGLDFAGITAGRVFDLSIDINDELNELAASGE